MPHGTSLLSRRRWIALAVIAGSKPAWGAGEWLIQGAHRRLRAGVLLIADRELRDPNFVHTVVLLIHYGGRGAAGVVINRRSRHRLADVLPDEAAVEGSDKHVWLGGPASPRTMTLLAETREPPVHALRVIGDVHASYSLEALRQVRERQAGPWRVYAGYAGWAPGQLEHEMARGDWLITPADRTDIFSAQPQQLWPRLYRRNSGRWVNWQSPKSSINQSLIRSYL